MKIGDGSPDFQIHIREYLPADLEDCLEIIASNEDVLPAQSQVLADFLTQGTSWFLVAEKKGKVVACGGLELAGDTNKGVLLFGLVEKSQQRQGIGTLLTLTRLTLVPDEDESTMVTLQASGLNEAFYTRFGFEPISAVLAHGDGTTSVTMGLWVTEEMKAEIRQNLKSMPVTFADGIVD